MGGARAQTWTADWAVRARLGLSDLLILEKGPSLGSQRVIPPPSIIAPRCLGSFRLMPPLYLQLFNLSEKRHDLTRLNPKVGGD